MNAETTTARIVLAIPSLGIGGAERQILLLAEQLLAVGYSLTLVVLGERSPRSFPIPQGLEIHFLGMSGRKQGAWRDNIQRVRTLRAFLREAQAQLLISFIPEMNVLGIFASWRICPVIISDRHHPDVEPRPRIWRLLRKLCYPFADAFVVQSFQYRAITPISPIATWNLRKRTHVIRNIVPTKTVLRSSLPKSENAPPVQEKPALPRLSFLSVSRLVPEKRLERILQACADFRVLSGSQDFCLSLLGDGPAKEYLLQQARELGLYEHLRFLGIQDCADIDLSAYDLFLFASEAEGLPNVLLECLHDNLPVISTDTAFGVSEILRDGESAILVHPKRLSEFPHAMHKALSWPKPQEHLLAKRQSEGDWGEPEKYWKKLVGDMLCKNL